MLRETHRYLIVNADDFGQSPGVNQGIIQAHRHGIVTGASLMVRWPAAAEAAAYSREYPDFSLGLHVDLCEWLCRDGEWITVYEVVPLHDAQTVADEAWRQLAAFRRLVGKDPSHIDSHQHVHREEPLRSVLAGMARELRVPLRHYSPEVRYCGDFYGQDDHGYPFPEGISVEALLRILQALVPGVTELGCHPGNEDDVDSMYQSERAIEVKTLCDPRVHATLVAEGIELRSFRSYPR